MKTAEPRKYPKPREALKRSERKASAPQPENFKDKENADKIVEVRPIDRDDSAIKGLDPED